ncbi:MULTISPECIES: hypothetical protein [Cupriavidus]|uniref:Uncharacterized protein n=3 Tax=Cupriavidus TaxID=106589 RepID=A0A7Z7JHZ0_9BURK|nr:MULTISPECIES: hypothetical protein [Cupriavidus]KAB0595283.1 hypothetical protein F7Q96_18435 [Cupriavidus gilardii]MBO4120583.1 hypothetical protein [Cupriavidus gilardii]MCT9074171.1 hypothetical protein [Cupriavidus gilardii]NNH12020.1 hypothetical protein [Cupriavidus gilardii]NOV26676.1 hypothetical protein [Cupriavidus necator]
MKVGKLLVLLGGAAMGIAPGAIGAIQIGWEPRQELSSNWWLQCGGVPAPAAPAMWPAVDHEWESRSLDCTAQRDKETPQYALAVNPRHRLFKHGNGAAAPSNTAKSKPSREAKRQNRDCGQPRPAPPQ